MLHDSQHSTAGLASWSDIPYEVLEQILCLCDNTSLLALGRVNHNLNWLALEEFFKRNAVTTPKNGYFISRLAPKEVIPALCSALWIQRLPHITYYLNPDFQRLLGEIRGLTALIHRLPSIDRLDLYFSSVDRWFNSRFKWGSATVPPALWLETFTVLLEMASSKGCKSMRVEGAHELESHYTNAPIQDPCCDPEPNSGCSPSTGDRVGPPVPSPRNKQTRHRFSRWIRKRLGLSTGQKSSLHISPSTPHTPIAKVRSSPTISHPTLSSPSRLQNSAPCLTSLSLRSSMLVQPLFFSHTLRLIQHHSCVMQHLELVSIKISEGVWGELFNSITLPVLESFTYLFDTLIVDEPKLSPRILLDFLVRHPTIVSLELYGVALPLVFPHLDHAILPNLKSLSAHPRIISWVLQDSNYCSQLESVCLTSEYPATRIFPHLQLAGPYQHFDNGILSVVAHSRPVRLQFQFSTERGLHEWIIQHINAGETSTLRQLTRVTHLTISCHFHTYFPPGDLDLLPRWFALFPSLEHLHMIEQPYPKELQTPAFRSAMLKVNPNLKSWAVGRNILLDDIKPADL